MHDVALHEIVLVKFGALDKTSSGKIRRHAVQARYLAGTLPVIDKRIFPLSSKG